MANRYWVAFSSTNWNDSFNWASTSGGLGGASVPSTGDDVFFDSNGPGSCSLDVNASVISITIDAGYTGTLDAVTFDLTTSGNFTDNAGRILFGSGTWNIGGNLTLRGTSNTNCQSVIASVTGNVFFNGASWIPGTSVWTVGGNVDAYNGQPASSSTYPNWSFTQTGTGKTASFRNFANYIIANGASITNARQITATNITIDGTHDLNGKIVNVVNLVVSSTGTIQSTASGGRVSFTVVTNSLVDIVVNIQGTLVLNSWKMDWQLRNCKYIYRLQTTSGLELPNFEFGAVSTAGNDNWRLQIENDVVFAQNFLFYSDGSGTPGSLNNSTYNPNITFKGDVTFRVPNGMNYNVGTGTITFEGSSAQSADFNGESVEAVVVSDNSVNTITLADNVTTPYVHDCANQIDENGYTVTTTGTDPSPCSTGARYWVGLVDTDYENTGNWSTSSGGLGGASVPVGSNDIYFDGNGSVNCTLGATRSVGGFDVDTAYGSTFNMNGHDFRIGGDCDLGSDSSGTIGITFNKGTGTLVFAGTTNLNFARASWSGSGSTVEWTGTHTLLTFYNGGAVSGTQNLTGSLTINPWIANSWAYEWQKGTINGTLTANNNIIFMGGSSLDVNISNNATVAGTGRVIFRGHLNCDLTLGSNVTFSIATVEFECYRLTLHGDFVADNNVLIDRWTTTSDQFTFAGNNVFSVGGNLTVSSSQGGSWNHTSKNVFYTIKGDVIYNGSMTWNAGNGTIILDNIVSQSIDFNGQTVEGIHVTDASTGSIVLANSFSTAWLRDCNSLIDLNGYTITNADTEDRCAYPYNPPTTIALDSSKAITTDLQAWWPLVDGSGTNPIDLSGNSEALSTTNSPSWGVKKLGNSLRTSVKTGYYSTNNPFSTIIGGTAPATDNFSISFWASMYGRAPYEYEDGVFSIGSTATDGSPFFVFQRDQTSGVRFYWGGGWTVLHSLSNYQWGHYVFTFNGTQMDSYVDGTYNSTRSSSGTFGNTSDKFWVGVGYNNTGGNDVADFLQNVRIWSRAVTSTEVASLYSDPWVGSDYTAVVPLTNRYFAPAAFRRLG